MGHPWYRSREEWLNAARARLLERFTPEPNSGCWLFDGFSDRYGYFNVAGKMMLAHRAAFLLFAGVDPGPLKVLHRCDVPPCIRPAHLFLGTQLENIHDCIRKGRARHVNLSGEAHGMAKLTAATVREIRERWLAGGERQNQLAREYGIGTSQVNRICAGSTWVSALEGKDRGDE